MTVINLQRFTCLRCSLFISVSNSNDEIIFGIRPKYHANSTFFAFQPEADVAKLGKSLKEYFYKIKEKYLSSFEQDPDEPKRKRRKEEFAI